MAIFFLSESFINADFVMEVLGALDLSRCGWGLVNDDPRLPKALHRRRK